MEYVILDLEWNTAYFRQQGTFVNEIIEFGAVKLDKSLNETDSFQMFVNSQNGHRLRSRVKELTHITNDDLKYNGLPFSQVVSKFKKWVDDDAVLLTWSTSDLFALLKNLEIFTSYTSIPFMHNYVDLQAYVQRVTHFDRSHQLGLAVVAEKMGIEYNPSELHRAEDDCRLCAQIMRQCYDDEKFKSAISNADNDEYYDRLFFKPYIIKNMNDINYSPNDLRFRCEKCGNHLRKSSAWHFKNRYFNASFICRECKLKYTGRVQFKQLYDQIVIRKMLESQTIESKTGEKENNNLIKNKKLD